MPDESRLPDPPEWNWREERKERQPERGETGDAAATSPKHARVERSLGIGIAIGYSFVGPVLGGILLGLWLDGWNPGGYTIVGLLLGMAGALLLLIRLVARLSRED